MNMEINIINSKDVNKLVKKGYFNIAFGGEPELNRRILENKNIQLLLDPEPLGDDFMHYRNSGLNQVLVKLAKKNNIGIGFSFDKLNRLNKINKSKLFGKIMQNIILCNKYKVDYYIYDLESNKNDLVSLGLSLGAKKVKII